MKITEKNDAIRLRKTGLTYKEILEKIPVAKSSLSYWLRGIELDEAQRRRIYDKNLYLRRKFVEYNELKHQKAVSKKRDIFNVASAEIGSLSGNELKLVGTALYWAEGYKTGRARCVEFTNSDPAMIRVIMKWFREICGVPDNKFRGRIQAHSNDNIGKATEFWAAITGIPLGQFTKAYVKISPTSKGRSGNILLYGICHIRIADIALLAKIKGWINGLGGPIV